MSNRKDRRAIQFGRGRNYPMVEVTDVQSCHMYLLSLPEYNEVAFPTSDNLERLFIGEQVGFFENIRGDLDFDLVDLGVLDFQ